MECNRGRLPRLYGDLLGIKDNGEKERSYGEFLGCSEGLRGDGGHAGRGGG